MFKRSAVYHSRLKQFTEKVDVYPVSCEKLAKGRSDREWLDAVLDGGASIVQLRDKESNDRELLAKARYFREKTKKCGALFIVNDRIDIAMLADADGIHVGQGDLPPEEVYSLVPDMLIGVSCNTIEQVERLGILENQKKLAASYYNIGPIYQTGTKEGLKEFVGPEAICDYSTYCSLPFTIMGGIKLHHVKELVRAGARRIAVVTAISQAEDITRETVRWKEEVKKSGEANG